MYPKQPKGTIAQQVRIEGFISELPFEDHMDLYNSEPLFCKVISIAPKISNLMRRPKQLTSLQNNFAPLLSFLDQIKDLSPG
jgi:pyridoxine/pyridoxamine 5'-phosphate oxidase